MTPKAPCHNLKRMSSKSGLNSFNIISQKLVAAKLSSDQWIPVTSDQVIQWLYLLWSASRVWSKSSKHWRGLSLNLTTAQTDKETETETELLILNIRYGLKQ